MTNILSQSKALVLIIKDFQAQLLVWENKTLTHLDFYSDFQDSQQRFDELLDARADYPVIIVNDVIEESFRNETVVHVGVNDRKAMLDRKLNYSFRNTTFRTARITGRESSGRRDDTVMLSALTKPELLNPWVDHLLKKNIAVQSVTSVAYLIEAYVSLVGKNNSEHMMLVSLEDNSNLRQTYLKSGRIMFSRLTTLSSEGAASLGESIHQESLQIRQYLERIKLLSYDNQLEIRVHAASDVAELAQSLPSSQSNTFQCFDTRQEALECDLELKDTIPGANILFLARVLQKKRVENTYAAFDVRRFFHLKTVSQVLALTASVIVVVSMAVNVPALSDIINKNNLRDVTEPQTLLLRTEYQLLTERFPETPIDSKEMSLVVQTFEAIQNQSFMPMQAMALVSQALAESPDLQISQFNWSLLERAVGLNDEQGFLGSGPPQNVAAGNEFTQAILDNRTILHVLIDGIAYSPSSYREA